MKLTRAFLRLSLLSLTVFAAIVSISLLYFSYEWFTAWVFGTYQQPDKLEKFRSALLTKDRFFVLQIGSLLLTCLFIVIAVYFWNRQSTILFWLHQIRCYVTGKFRQVFQFWQSLPVAERIITIILFVCILLLRLYFLSLLPFHIDERFTYLYFVSKGLGVSMAYYPNPNNHILFTLLCNVSALFFDDPWWVMKMPALLSGLGVVILFWAILRITSGFYTAFLATVFFACSGQVWYYGLQGRGYSLLMIFTLIATISAFRIMQDGKPQLNTFFYLWLSGTLGFYTIPVFLYPFAAIITLVGSYLLLKSEIKLFIWLSITVLFVVVSSLLLYLPVFIFNGWTAVSGNSWVKPIPWSDFMHMLPGHLLELADNMWGFFPYGQWALLLVLLFCVVILFNKQTPVFARRWIILFITNLAVLIILCLIQRVILFQRLLIYLSIFQYLILAFAVVSLIQRLINKSVYRLSTILFISILYIGTTTYAFYKQISPQRFDLYDSFDNTARLLFQKKADYIFVNMYEYSLCIRFQYETNGRTIHLDTNQPVGGVAYNYLVVHKSQIFPPQIPILHYKYLYSDVEVVIYERISKILD